MTHKIRLPKIFMLGNYIGVKKLINLVSKPIKPIKQAFENLIIIIIRGRYILTGRENQQANETLRTEQYSVLSSSESETILSETITFETKLLNTPQLQENQPTTDGVNTTKKNRTIEQISETQDSNESTTVTTATLTSETCLETITEEVTWSTTPQETIELTDTVPTQTDSIAYTTYQRTIITLEESTTTPTDSIDIQQQTIHTYTFDESVTTQDGIQVDTPQLKVVRIVDKQVSGEIAVAYIPTDTETLTLYAFPESQQVLESSMWQTITLTTISFDESATTQDEILAVIPTFDNIAEWYTEYQATLTQSLSESTTPTDSLTTQTAILTTQSFDESTTPTDTLETYTASSTSADEFTNISCWYAEYSVA